MKGLSNPNRSNILAVNDLRLAGKLHTYPCCEIGKAKCKLIRATIIRNSKKLGLELINTLSITAANWMGIHLLDMFATWLV